MTTEAKLKRALVKITEAAKKGYAVNNNICMTLALAKAINTGIQLLDKLNKKAA